MSLAAQTTAHIFLSLSHSHCVPGFPLQLDPGNGRPCCFLSREHRWLALPHQLGLLVGFLLQDPIPGIQCHAELTSCLGRPHTSYPHLLATSPLDSCLLNAGQERGPLHESVLGLWDLSSRLPRKGSAVGGLRLRMPGVPAEPHCVAPNKFFFLAGPQFPSRSGNWWLSEESVGK